ncbi:L-selectin [Bagarius yarrelli]|uniref:L-selectin n=1 Tax=Bagarius yarrelli TaxID=175774 RepID=A0A556TUC8_BAGYA|nr:L-selectin [Bagarius yarrelli]
MDEDSFYKEGEKIFTAWFREPNNYNGKELCVFMRYDGKWSDADCNNNKSFVCYDAMPSISHQYHFVDKNMTWTEAQIYCREFYRDLATVDNMEEINSLVNVVNGSHSGLAWIGLYDSQDDWTWSLDDDFFYKEGDREFRGWYHEPNNHNGKELCVSMYYTGEWFDQQCTQELGFVCYNSTSNTHVWISEKMTWVEAQSFCRAKHTDLTSVRNETELKQILSIANGYDVWIGLYRNRLWSDQSNSTYAYWRQEKQQHPIDEPDNGLYSFGQTGNQHCTAMDSTGQWTDENCLESFPFFCYTRTNELPAEIVGGDVNDQCYLSPSIPRLR